MISGTRATARAALAAIREAEAVRGELDAVLRQSGVALPSLGLVASSIAADPVRPLLDLGRCNLSTARALTAALRQVVPPAPGPGAAR